MFELNMVCLRISSFLYIIWISLYEPNKWGIIFLSELNMVCEFYEELCMSLTKHNTESRNLGTVSLVLLGSSIKSFHLPIYLFHPKHIRFVLTAMEFKLMFKPNLWPPKCSKAVTNPRTPKPTSISISEARGARGGLQLFQNFHLQYLP